MSKSLSECSITDFQLLTSKGMRKLSSECDIDQTKGEVTTSSLCAQEACTRGANVFLYQVNSAEKYLLMKRKFKIKVEFLHCFYQVKSYWVVSM